MDSASHLLSPMGSYTAGELGWAHPCQGRLCSRRAAWPLARDDRCLLSGLPAVRPWASHLNLPGPSFSPPFSENARTQVTQGWGGLEGPTYAKCRVSLRLMGGARHTLWAQSRDVRRCVSPERLAGHRTAARGSGGSALRKCQQPSMMISHKRSQSRRRVYGAGAGLGEILEDVSTL